MSELTKEHFDEKLEEIAQAVARGFDSTATKDDIQELGDKIDAVDSRLQTVEAKLDRALYTEVVHLEARLRRVEEKLHIKSPEVKPFTT